MTYTAYSGEFVPFRSETTAGHAAERRPGILRRILDAIYESNRKKAERDIAHYIQRNGGRLTDDIERQIMERIVRGDCNFRR
jgi:hypothetical protein